MELKLEHITKRYQTTVALKDFSYTFQEGVYGLLGPNGAGKSTMMNLIVDSLTADEGKILYDGKEIKTLGAEYLKLLGYMPQQQNLYKTFTGTRFMFYMAALKGLKKEEAKEQIPKLFERVNLSGDAGKRLGAYSGGMKQRILIAQALLGNPKILILDEPTAGLDPKERIRIRNMISEISLEKIVIVATHVVTDVECIAKEVLLLRKGELIDSGSPEKLLEQVVPYVFEAEVEPDALPLLQQQYQIGNINKTVSGKLLVRLVGDEMPKQHNCHSPQPNLEDVYLYRFER